MHDNEHTTPAPRRARQPLQPSRRALSALIEGARGRGEGARGCTAKAGEDSLVLGELEGAGGAVERIGCGRILGGPAPVERL